MGFVAICTALYDYEPQSSEELELKEGEILFILEKDGGDDWWKAKKKANVDEDDEPEGLIPRNYVEDTKPIERAKAMYDYTRQTDEEVSFSEDADIEIYDTSDPDWTLVKVNHEFGFAPANYIEAAGPVAKSPSIASPVAAYNPPAPAAEEEEEYSPPTPVSPTRAPSGPAAALASVLGGGAPQAAAPTRSIVSSPPQPPRQFTPEASDEEEPAPALPRRPPSQVVSPTVPQVATFRQEEAPGVLPSPPYNRAVPAVQSDDAPMRSPGGYHLYNISEMISVMGRRKKMPTTLGLNIATGTIMLSPEKSRDGPTQEWTADRLNHYSIEGKHVFMELVRPSKSLDLHAGAKDTAQEIVGALGEIAGAHRAAGLKEIVAAGTSGGALKKGISLYDFMAQGEDEVTVAVGDEVIILDDEKSEEWWHVRRTKNGSEGVMPSSYIEVTGIVAKESASRSGVNAGRSTVEQNRLEEERLAKEAAKQNRAKEDEARSREIALPERGSSLGDDDVRKSSRKDKRSNRSDGKQRSKPDPTKTRTWTDHSGSFKVEAQFVGIADGKIHLHKINGVKIAVPVVKMSPEDLDYVEKLKRKDASTGRSGATIDTSKSQSKTPDYDWFDFFLTAGVGPHQCERYAQSMVKDSMDETILPDITTDTLRTLGLKEGDAIKVMKYLDQKFNRNRTNGVAADGNTGGIFSGPGGSLHNNTRRARPDANRQVSDVVDAGAFDVAGKQAPGETQATPLTQAPPREAQGGFDDDAWEVKPSKPAAVTQVAPAPVASPPPNVQPPSANLQALSLLDKPLEPTPAAPPRPASQPQVSIPAAQSPPPAATQQPQQTGANPAFFAQVNQQQLNAPRQRPQAPQQSFTGTALLPPPPRPFSAPQNAPNQYTGQGILPQPTGIPRTAANQTAPGQSLDEITAQQMQQRFLQMQPTGYGMQNGFVPQQTGFQPQPQFNQQFQQSYLTGNVQGSPFADPRPSFQPQPTGFNLRPGPAPGSLNSVLPPALQPQPTGYQSPNPQMQVNGFNQGFQPQQTGFVQQQQQPLQPQMTGYIQPQPTGFGQFPQQNGFGTQLPPVPPLPQSTTPAPLLPQKTGPAPAIKFGVPDRAEKLVPQPTGRRANLANASAANPFGF